MPSGLSSILGKSMGPLETAIGLGMSIFGGPAGIMMGAPMALGGVTQMTGPGGVAGPSLTPTLPSQTPPPNVAATPMGGAPSMPSSAGGGLSMTTPGAGAGTGGAPDMGSQIASNLLSSNNPFAQYAAAA
jgi:hypothetical protein